MERKLPISMPKFTFADLHSKQELDLENESDNSIQETVHHNAPKIVSTTEGPA
jgi:hypothetical protein